MKIEMYKTSDGYKIRKGSKKKGWLYVEGYYDGVYKWVTDYTYARPYKKETAKKHIRRIEIADDTYEGDELCCECDEEFCFLVTPSKGVEIKCPNCGAIQHPCSLCDSRMAECCEGRCKYWIIESLLKYNEEEEDE